MHTHFIYKNKYIDASHLGFHVLETAQKDFKAERRIRKEVLFCSAFLNHMYFSGAVEVAGTFLSNANLPLMVFFLHLGGFVLGASLKV